jgi:5-methylcytosine-specific restriction endonuclease McrA
VHWPINCKKASGALRAQFSQFLIPASVRTELGLTDGVQCRIVVTHGDFVHDAVFKLTSGCEFRLPNSVALELDARARLSPDSSIRFDLTGADQVAALIREFERKVEESKLLPRNDRAKRLASAPRLPQVRQVTTLVYERNPDVVAAVLERAKGVCQDCEKPAPFLRKADGSPYLEVHHRQQLADGGEDTVENSVALCPNCHRRAHHGA